MPTAILGKDCTISGGGLDNAQVRDVSITWQAEEVQWHPLLEPNVYVWNAGYTVTVEADVLQDGSSNFDDVKTGSLVTLSGSVSGSFVVTGVQRSEPLSGAVAMRVQMKRSQ